MILLCLRSTGLFFIKLCVMVYMLFVNAMLGMKLDCPVQKEVRHLNEDK